ncbi:MAG: thioredoxin [Nitrososphaerales archaeon]
MSDPELEEILNKKMRDLQHRAERVKMGGGSVKLTGSNFNMIMSDNKPVLVDFWAEWCGPCRVMHPVFEKLASEYDGKMVFARLNVDENGEMAAKYRVMSIPTFMVFSGGKPVDMVVGAVGEEGLKKLIQKHIGSS